MELQWDYYGPFGFAAVLAEADEPMYDTDMKVTADLLRKKRSPSTAPSSMSSTRS